MDGTQIWLTMEHGCHQDRVWLNLIQFAIVQGAHNTFILMLSQIIQLTTLLLILELITISLKLVNIWYGLKEILNMNGL